MSLAASMSGIWPPYCNTAAASWHMTTCMAVCTAAALLQAAAAWALAQAVAHLLMQVGYAQDQLHEGQHDLALAQQLPLPLLEQAVQVSCLTYMAQTLTICILKAEAAEGLGICMCVLLSCVLRRLLLHAEIR